MPFRAWVRSTFAIAALFGCAPHPSQPIVDVDEHAPRSDPDGPEASPQSARPADPVLSERAALVALPVDGYEPSVVAVPMGATTQKPVLVAAHGAGGSPEWYCAFWRDVLGARAFVLCPRGRATSVFDPPDQRGYYYPDHHFLVREVNAALAALSARYPQHVDPGPVVFMGFSQGAIMGAIMLRTAPDRFSRAILVEGGFAEWSVPVARAYAKRGGQRVLFGCGNGGCATTAREAIRYLDKAGVQTRLIYDPKTGHDIAGKLASELVQSFEWVVEGDPRWAR
jgi:predicted esterase